MYIHMYLACTTAPILATYHADLIPTCRTYWKEGREGKRKAKKEETSRTFVRIFDNTRKERKGETDEQIKV